MSRRGNRVSRVWYWLTLQDPIGTPVAAVAGLLVGLLIAWRFFG
jgi:hypothetical protein